MFTSDLNTDIFLFNLFCCTAGVVLGLISIRMLPWTDKEIEEVDQSARRLVAGIGQRLMSFRYETPKARLSPMRRTVRHRAIRT